MATPGRSADEKLGLGSATALVVGHTIGVGVFLTPAALIGALGAPALTLGVWVLCAAMVFAGALAFGELASRFPSAGGPYVYLREAWGEQVAFLYGWQSLLVVDPGVTAALAAGVSQYLAAAWPGVEGGRWIAPATIWSLAFVNMAGLRAGARVMSVLTSIKVLAIVFVVALAFLSAGGSWMHFTPLTSRAPFGPPLGEALALALVGAFFSFGGFWEASRMAGEVRDVNRTLPRALGLGVASITAVYVVTTAAFLFLVPARDSVDPSEFIQRAGLAMAGPAGPRVLASVVLVSVVASLAALLMMAPRLYVAMSRDAVLPRWVAPSDPTSDSSKGGTLALATLSTVYASVASFEQIVAFFFCTALAFVALSVAGLFVVRARVARERPGVFQCPGYPLVPAAFLLLLVAVITMVAAARPVQAIGGAAIVMAGVPAYRVLKSRGALARHVPQGVES